MATRILVVDDEPYIRDLVSSLLRERQDDYAIVGEAINGSLALDFLGENKVDLVLTDVRMPVMDGLDLIREAKKRRHDAAFVILSAYGEFHLAKEAFLLGASDYLLKAEITREELLRVVDKAVAEVSGKGQGSRRPEDMGPLLKDLVAGSTASGGRLLEAIKEGLGDEAPRFRLMALEVTGVRKAAFFHPESRISLSDSSLGIAEAEGGPNAGILCSTPMHDGVTVSLFRFSGRPGEVPQADDHFRRVLDRVAAAGLELVGGISSDSASLEKLPDLYKEALSAKASWFLLGRGRLLRHSGTRAAATPRPALPLSGNRERLRETLELKNAAEIEGRIEGLLVDPLVASVQDTDSVRGLFADYFSLLAKFVEAEGLDESREMKPHLEEFDAYIRDEGSLEECNGWLRHFLRHLCDALQGRSHLVRKAVEHVVAHFDDDLGLMEMSRILGVSEVHLSRTFSKEMKCGFVAYLAKTRMDHALQLLRSTDLRIYEIAERTGYRNVEHFSRTFKKIIGRSPKEFR